MKFDKKDLSSLMRVADKNEDVADTVDVPSLLESAAYVLIAAGAFMFVVGFLGCVGAMKEVRVFLIIVSLCLVFTSNRYTCSWELLSQPSMKWLLKNLIQLFEMS